MRVQRRSLVGVTTFDVQLFLDLQFVQEIVILDFESLDNSHPNVAHFCSAIKAQASQWSTGADGLICTILEEKAIEHLLTPAHLVFNLEYDVFDT
jgi:hypothetical protein